MGARGGRSSGASCWGWPPTDREENTFLAIKTGKRTNSTCPLPSGDVSGLLPDISPRTQSPPPLSPHTRRAIMVSHPARTPLPPRVAHSPVVVHRGAEVHPPAWHHLRHRDRHGGLLALVLARPHWTVLGCGPAVGRCYFVVEPVVCGREEGKVERYGAAETCIS